MANLGWLPGNRFPSDRRIGKVAFPVMIVHGSGDTVIPAAHGKKLYSLVRSPRKRFFEVRGAGHNDILGVAGAEYWRVLADFLAPQGRK